MLNWFPFPATNSGSATVDEYVSDPPRPPSSSDDSDDRDVSDAEARADTIELITELGMTAVVGPTLLLIVVAAQMVMGTEFGILLWVPAAMALVGGAAVTMLFLHVGVPREMASMTIVLIGLGALVSLSIIGIIGTEFAVVAHEQAGHSPDISWSMVTDFQMGLYATGGAIIAAAALMGSAVQLSKQ